MLVWGFAKFNEMTCNVLTVEDDTEKLVRSHLCLGISKEF